MSRAEPKKSPQAAAQTDTASLRTAEDTELRRRPEQKRSRERVGAILQAAAELIAEKGSAGLSMTDIANRAGTSKPALYRYFPNLRALLRELAQEVFAGDHAAIVLRHSAEHRDLRSILKEGLRWYCTLHKAEPFRLPLRVAIQADAELSALDLADSRKNAAAIAEFMIANGSRKSLGLLVPQALLTLELLDGVIRLVARVEVEEGERLFEEFCEMAVNHLV